jgi:hypothetical protein
MVGTRVRGKREREGEQKKKRVRERWWDGGKEGERR